jgi:hypothetical protein
VEEHRTRSILDETSGFDVRVVVTFGRKLARILSRIFSAAFCVFRVTKYVSPPHVFSLCEMSFNET